MNTAREYRIPLMIGAGALVAALILWAVLISPQTSKLASLQTKEVELQQQQSGLQVKLASLKAEKQNLTKSCADLEKISAQIPSVESPTDVDAEESSFESQFNGLAASSGVTLTQFSGFAPASSTTATPSSPATPATSGSSTAPRTPTGVVAVPTTLSVTGNYSQMTSFVKGLDSFPRLFVIQTFNLVYGATAPSPTGSSSSGSATTSGSSASVSANSPPLWVGGSANSPSAGPYTLSIDGSIYYTTTPNALAACTKATSVH